MMEALYLATTTHAGDVPAQTSVAEVTQSLCNTWGWPVLEAKLRAGRHLPGLSLRLLCLLLDLEGLGQFHLL